MKIFISWSGNTSQDVGLALKDFLESVIQSLEVFISTEMDRGSLWNKLINDELRNTGCGIICLTSENYDAPWILFESGALAKGIEQSRVCTFLINIDPSVLLKSPLSQFNHTKSDKESILSLVKTLNNLLDTPLSDKKLINAFDKFWPDYAQRFDEIVSLNKPTSKPKQPAYKELATETLEVLNRINRQLAIDDFSVGDKIRKIEYRLAKLYSLEFQKQTDAKAMTLNYKTFDETDSSMNVWVYYRDDFEDEIALAANEILNNLEITLKDDFAKYECNFYDEYSGQEAAIKYTFLRKDLITNAEYRSVCNASDLAFQKHQIKIGGIRCSGERID